MSYDTIIEIENEQPRDLFGEIISQRSMSLSTSNGLNDYFLFNDLRNGPSTIHSWDILDTTERQKKICYLLLKNRRKSAYGNLDGNPLSLKHFQDLDNSINETELDKLVELKILKKDSYSFKINREKAIDLSEEENIILNNCDDNLLVVDVLKMNRELKLKKISLSKTLPLLIEKEILIQFYLFGINSKYWGGINFPYSTFLFFSNIS